MNRNHKHDQAARSRTKLVAPTVGHPVGGLTTMERETRPRLFDSSIVSNAQEAVDFITNILESSTEYSVIAKDLSGKILLWNEGAKRLYGYEPDEVVGKANSSILHTHADIQAGLPQQIMSAAATHGNGRARSPADVRTASSSPLGSSSRLGVTWRGSRLAFCSCPKTSPRRSASQNMPAA